MFRMKCSTSSLGPIGQVHASALSWMMTSQMRTSYHTYENRTLSMLLLLLDSHSNLLQFLLNKTLTRLHARQSPRCTHITAARWRIKIIIQMAQITAAKHTAMCAFWQNLLVQHRPTFPFQSRLLVCFCGIGLKPTLTTPQVYRVYIYIYIQCN